MTPRLLLLTGACAAAVVMMCCSSSEDAPATLPTVDGGPDTDATGGGDTGTDAPPATSSADYKSGTRLRAQLLTADGVSLWTAWKDTKLGVDCEFSLAEDKKLRCIPTAETLDGVTFSDAACKNAVHRGRPGCGVPIIARAFNRTCGSGLSVFRLGAMIAPAEVYEKSAGGCNAIPVSGFDVYPVTTAVTPAELVAATETQVPVGGGLANTVLTAEDGASQISALHDVGRKVACVRGGGTKDDRCIPTNMAFEEHIYSDVGCLSSAAYRPAYGNDCTSPPAVILKDGLPGACGVYEAAYAEVGAKVTTSTLYRKTATTCEDANITPDPFGTYWSLGAALPQTSLPALTNVDEGTGRIRLRADATSSSTRLRGRTFFDTERKAACIVLPTSDGLERCTPLPSAETQPSEFSDDQCTKPLAHAAPGCAPPTFVETFEPGPNACKGARRHFFAVGAKVTPAQVYRLNGPCMAGPLDGTVELYDAATEIPPSAFVALARKTD